MSNRPDPQAEIITIGDFNELGQPIGWVFKGTYSHAAAIDLGNVDHSFDIDQIRWSGYTADELRAIKEAHQ